MKKTFIARTLKNQTIAPYLNFADFNLDDIVVVYGQTCNMYNSNCSKTQAEFVDDAFGEWWLRKKQNFDSNPTNQPTKKPPLSSSTTKILPFTMCNEFDQRLNVEFKKKNFSLFFSSLTE